MLINSFGMFIERIEITNFRKFDKLDLELNEGLNVFVGENNSGKTAIVDAIRFVLDTNSSEHIYINESDFYDKEAEFTIKLTFGGLSVVDGGVFLSCLTYEKDEEPKLYLTLKCNKTKSGTTRRGYIKKTLRTGKNGDGNIFEGDLREFLNITYLKPLRDAESELSAGRKSRLSKILEGYFDLKDKDFAKNFDDKIINIEVKGLIDTCNKFNENITEQLNKLKIKKENDNKLLTKIKTNYLDKISLIKKEIKLSIAEGTTDQEKYKSLLKKLDLTYKDTKGKQGLGYQNLLFMAVEMLLLEKDKESPCKILVIEEPEAHLHPQHQAKFLKFISKHTDNNLQTFITTHSPNLSSKVPIEKMFLCVAGKIFSLKQEKTGLSNNDYRFLEKFLDVTKADLFFAKGLIFVEGISEQLILPSYAKALGKSFEDDGISIINIGHTGFSRFVNIFKDKELQERISIPISCIRDLDAYEEDGKWYKVGKKRVPIKYIEKHKKGLRDKIDNGQSHKVFISDYRTLEYDLCNIDKIKFWKAIRNTYKDKKSRLNKDSLEQDVINAVENRGKSEVAFELARIIDEKNSKKLKIKIPKYIKDGILHVFGESEEGKVKNEQN